MKRIIALSIAVIMLMSCVFVIASCGGKKTYTYSDANITVDAGSMTSLLGGMVDEIKNSMAAQLKDATIEIDGNTVTLKQGNETKTLNCTRNGDKLEFSSKDLGDLTSGMGGGNVTAYIIEKDGATMVMEASMTVEALGISIGIKVELIFK